MKLYKKHDCYTLLVEYIEGQVLRDYRESNPKKIKEVNKELQKHYVLDCLFGNWDVIGIEADNIVIGKTYF
jgi:hypothetical protein